MAKIPLLKCGDCKRELSPTERRWEHHTKGGLRIESFCEECMRGQVNDYVQRTIMGMLDGQVEVRINDEAIRVVGAKVVGGARSEPEE